jgi:hypothetical protein
MVHGHASGPCQSSHSRVQVPQNSDHILLPHLRLPWRARSSYLYPPGTGWPSYIPGTGFPVCRFLRLAGLRWRYSTPPSHGKLLTCTAYEISARTARKIPLLCCSAIVAVETCLFPEPLLSSCCSVVFLFRSRYLTTGLLPEYHSRDFGIDGYD